MNHTLNRILFILLSAVANGIPVSEFFSPQTESVSRLQNGDTSTSAQINLNVVTMFYQQSVITLFVSLIQ